MGKNRAVRKRGSIRKHKGRWYAITPDKKWHRCEPNTRQRAEEVLAEELRRYDRRKGHLTVDGMDVPTYVAYWLDGHKASIDRSTYLGYESYLRNHIKPGLAGIPMDRLDAIQLHAFYADLLDEKGLSRKTVQRINAIIRGAYKMAVGAGVVPINPAVHVTIPGRDKRKGQGEGIPENTIFTPEELRRFLDGTRGTWMYPCWSLIAATGIRRSEAAGLRWSKVNLEAGEIYIHEKRTQQGGEIITGEVKTEGSYRTIPLDDVTLADLKEWRKAQTELRMKFGPAWPGEDYVFTMPTGKPMTPDYMSKRFCKDRDRLGLKPTVTLHGLRHTFATLMLDAGVPVKTVSSILGHSDVAFTQNTYVKSRQDTIRAAMGAWRNAQ